MARFGAEPKLSPKEIEEKIRKKAYELYLKRGGQHGRSWNDWLEAERLVKSGRA